MLPSELQARIDVIIPCYNSAATLPRAIESALRQSAVARVWVIDDGSQDQSVEIALQSQSQFEKDGVSRIVIESLGKNYGAATARNWGAIRSQQTLIAFLDADDAYKPNALDAAIFALHYHAQIGMVRLALHPIGLAESYLQHPGYARAWRSMEMTGAGNTVWRRNLFLATGGFPQEALFQRLGGEDAALNIAMPSQIQVGTLFNENGVEHYCKAGTHAEKLLRAHLYGEMPAGVTQAALDQANAITVRITQQLEQLRGTLNQTERGVVPLAVERK